MILVIIIISILYLIMIYCVLSLYYTYKKDIEELENRLLQLEKRDSLNTKYVTNCFMELYDMINEKEDKKNIPSKEGEKCMACKKGRGGRKK